MAIYKQIRGKGGSIVLKYVSGPVQSPSFFAKPSKERHVGPEPKRQIVEQKVPGTQRCWVMVHFKHGEYEALVNVARVIRQWRERPIEPKLKAATQRDLAKHGLSVVRSADLDVLHRASFDLTTMPQQSEKRPRKRT